MKSEKFLVNSEEGIVFSEEWVRMWLVWIYGTVDLADLLIDGDFGFMWDKVSEALSLRNLCACGCRERLFDVSIFVFVGRETQGYAFAYDDLDRLTNANYVDYHDPGATASGYHTTDNKFGDSANYDIRGNITSLNRNGLQQAQVNYSSGVT